MSDYHDIRPHTNIHGLLINDPSHCHPFEADVCISTLTDSHTHCLQVATAWVVAVRRRRGGLYGTLVTNHSTWRCSISSTRRDQGGGLLGNCSIGEQNH